MDTTTPDITYLFEPRAIAVIGASSNPKKIGYTIVDNIVSGGYKGNIYPINPKGGEILGKKVFTDLNNIEGPIDVGIIVIPSKFVVTAVKACVDRGIKFLTVISSGFSEVGNIDEEREMVEYANAHGARILGPNVFGVYSAEASLNSTFGPKNIYPGGVAIITQSGALGLSMIGKTAVEKIGLSSIVSVGNKSDIDEADLLEYLIPQKKTKIIMMYIEGVRNGEKLIRSLKKATKVKPVVVIKSGRSKRGAVAAASHTGSLAGSDNIFDKVMRQCGVIRAESIKDAFNWCKYLSQSPFPAGDKAVIITNGGGIGVMATDACEKFGVELYDDKAILKEVFSSVTPGFGSTKNPIDVTGSATAEDYNNALDAALSHDEIHAVIAIYCETAILDTDHLIDMIKRNAKNYREKGKPLAFCVFGGQKSEACIQQLRTEQVPIFTDIYEAVDCLGTLYQHIVYVREHGDLHRHNALRRLAGYNQYSERIKSADNLVDFDRDAVKAVINSVREDKRTFLLPKEAQELMQCFDIAVPITKVAKNLSEAVSFAEEIGYPVVLKVTSRDIIHKSDAGGIALNLENEKEVMDAYQAIMYRCRSYNPRARIDGVEVSEMVKKDTEVIIGARRDDIFGPIVMFGLGGIYVEVMKDVSFRSFPLSKKETFRMLKDTKSFPLLLGVRGEKKKDISTVVDTIIKIGTLLDKCPDISDIEINPLVVYKDKRGVKAVDVRIILKDKKEGDTHE